MPHPATLTEEALVGDCDMRLERRSGPGGQHRNKVETAVVLQHRPSGVSAEANERRSQNENRKVAIFRLRLALAIDLSVAEQFSSEWASPSPLWCERRAGKQMKVSSEHRDFPPILAEAISKVLQHDWDASAAAAELAISTSQFLKLMGKHPPALRLINQTRQKMGLHAYKIG
ncbi:MAG: peptide chain release factor-like protein [Planctomycetota bacterium]